MHKFGQPFFSKHIKKTPHVFLTMLLYYRFYSLCGLCLDQVWFVVMPVMLFLFSGELHSVSDHFRDSDMTILGNTVGYGLKCITAVHR